MTTTTAAYLSVTQNLARYQAMTAAEPAVKSATAYYEANIGKVASIQDFVGNYRLLSYALDAYGLGDQVHNTALIEKVLEGGVSNPKSLANTLSDSRWKAFADGVRFRRQGSVFRIVGERRQDDDRGLCRAAARERPGRAGRRRPARALFPARRADHLQRIRRPRRPKPARSRADHFRPVAVDQRDRHRRAGQDAVEADAALGLAGSQEASAAHRALHRNVRSDLRAGLGRDDLAHRVVGQFEFERVGRVDNSRWRHPVERSVDRHGAERFHRRCRLRCSPPR